MNEKDDFPALKKLRVNYMESPLALDDPHPSFSWQMEMKADGRLLPQLRRLPLCAVILY